MICPGIGISADALFQRTARLPRVDIRKPARVIGSNTVGSLQSGLYYGYLGLVDGILDELMKEMGSDTKVVATGGLATLIGTALAPHPRGRRLPHTRRAAHYLGAQREPEARSRHEGYNCSQSQAHKTSRRAIEHKALAWRQAPFDIALIFIRSGGAF